MTNEQIIRDAINESIRRGEIVSVTIRGTDQDLHDAVTATEIGEWDSNGQPDGSIDVYTLDGNPREWRIEVTLENPETKIYDYKTDGESGEIEATDWDDACRQLDAMLTPAMIADGGWGWIENEDGERYEIGSR